MTGHYGPEEWWYPDGTSAANVRAVVFEGDQSTLASIYSDAGLTTALPNPTTTDGSGLLEFYAVDGDYWIFVGDENYGDSVLATLGPPVTGTGGALLISNNLSDLSNVVTARSNLGLGTAALADTGVGPTNVILGNDARLTDARTPTAHAASHGALGSDPVTIAESQVTGLVADLAAKQSLAAIDAKGDLYAGTGDNATARRSVGADGEVLVADSGDPTGLSWAPIGTDPTAQSRLVIDAKGDLYAGTGNDATTRLPVGTDGQALRANSATGTGLEWDTLTAGDVGADPAGSAAAAQAASQPVDSDLTVIAGLTPTDDDIIQRKAGVWTNRSVAQYKVDQAYTPADIGAVPTSRILTAGIALSGGGDLSADRTFDVDLGTTAGTAAEGNDARIVGAQQRSTLTTKGDLYAATAAATTTRVPVGADGEVLTADSSDPTGLTWATAGGGGAVDSVNGQTGVVVLDATDVGADPAGSAAAAAAASQPLATIDAKGDLYVGTADNTTARLAVGADGTVLTADATQATGQKWAAAPVDAGAQQRSTLTTKGDLYVATASATTTRQGVGTNGYVLVADSAQTNGIKWATDKSFTFMPRSTGFISANGVATARSSKAAALNNMFLLPFTIMVDATTSTIAFEITGNVATAVVRLGFYALDPVTLLPTGAAVVDFGTTTADTTSTKNFAAVQALTAGGWALAFVAQTAAPTIRHCAGFNPLVASATFPAGTGLGWNNGWVQTGVSGTLPTIGTIVDTDTPMCGIKF